MALIERGIIMQILSCVEFTMLNDNDYNIMQWIMKKIHDSYDNRWDMAENNPETRTIKFEDVLATQDDVVELSAEIIENIIKYLLENAPEQIKNTLCDFTYKIHAYTDNGGYEETDYIIERKGDKLTMKSSSFFFEDYDEDDDDCMEEYEQWQDNPDYDCEIDIKKDYIKTHKIIDISDKISQNLSVNEVYNIISGLGNQK